MGEGVKNILTYLRMEIMDDQTKMFTNFSGEEKTTFYRYSVRIGRVHLIDNNKRD